MSTSLFLNILHRRSLNVLFSSISKVKFNRSLVILQQNLLLSKEDSTSATSAAGFKKPFKKDVVKITLISPNNSITVTSLEEAQKLSKRRELKLIKVQDLDPKTQRPVYKLATPAELLSEETEDAKNTKETTKRKSEKNLTIGSKIADHDLTSRIKNVMKWLAKGHEVRVFIQGVSTDDNSNCEVVFNKIETSIKELNNGKIIQKKNKNGNIKFSILPITLDKTKS